MVQPKHGSTNCFFLIPVFVRPKRPSLSLDMAPLIDVVFQLLIFFMLSSSFNMPRLSLALPKADGSPDPVGPTPLMISVDRDGAVFLNHERVERSTFAARLKDYVAETGDRRVTIRMDGTRPYQDFAELMKEARDAGATQLQIIYERRRTP